MADGRIECLRAVVHPWHQDSFGHMNVRNYAPFFDDAGYHAWTLMGLPLSRIEAEHGVHTVAAKTTTTYVKELVAGDLIVIDCAVMRIGGKSATLELRMFHADTGALHATYECVDVFFDPKTRRSAAMPDAVRAKLEAHLAAPVPA